MRIQIKEKKEEDMEWKESPVFKKWSKCPEARTY